MTSDIKRQLGMDMVSGSYDMSEQASRVRTIDGEVICPPGQTRNDWRNDFTIPMRLFIRGGKVQRAEPIWDVE